jgi:sterol desaturase/sphingolipid hydroxylase (fatty acid hydroxylase superfamily)
MQPLDLWLWIAQVAAVAFLFWLESLVPLFAREPGRRVPHALHNISIALLNGLLTIALSGVILLAVRWAEQPFGLLHRLPLSGGMQLLAGFILFDLWMYLWHRMNHGLPFFWRFHRMHHSDTEMDVTTAMRFHAGELALSTLFRIAVIPLLGISLTNLLIYEIILHPVIYLHHSNVALPERLDRLLRLVVVSPNMHRVHHSDIPSETNSNYASVFSVWDRIGRTHRDRDVRTIRYGLNLFREERWQKVPGMLATPFV